MQTTENQNNKRINFVNTFQQPPKRTEQKKYANFILLMGIFFSIASLMPLIVAPIPPSKSPTISNNSTTARVVTTDDYSYITAYNSIPLFNQAAISPLMLCVLPAMDVLIDLLPVHWFFFTERTVVDSKDMPDVVRLTVQERVLFIVGLLSMSEVVFPAVVNSGNQANIFFCFENVSTIFTILPIISFLCRTSSVFTPLNTILISLIVCIGSLISSIGITIPTTNTKLIALFSTVVCGLMDTAAGLFFIVCCISMIKYFMQARPRLSDNNRMGWKDKEEINEERFRTFVVASHMFTTLVELILNGVWYWYNGSPAKQLGMFIYVMVATSTIVFVVELRIRKNEVTRALRALVGSVKKSYVRYISHELRTPLNCAFLGLKVLTTQYERSNNPKDKVNLEIIVDVNQSLNASLDILNDLLSLDKLENGMLDMNGQETSVLPFLRSAVEMFSAEARENEINLQFSHEPSTDNDHGKFGTLRSGLELSLRESDLIMMDRFKMNQVIRNLISNALKFTFRGGNIQVHAVFVPGGRISSSTNQDASLLNREYTQRMMSAGYTILHHLFGFGPVEDSTVDVETGSPSSVEPVRRNSTNINGVLRVIVTDDGAGISIINQSRLFHEVIQFSPERLQAGGGSGYGLCIAKGIVNIHDGFIGVFSQGEGKGSTFVVEIPMQRNPLISVNSKDADDNDNDTLASLPVGVHKNNNKKNTSRVKLVTSEENLSLILSTNNTEQHERRDSSGSSSGHRRNRDHHAVTSPSSHALLRPSSVTSSISQYSDHESHQSPLSSAYNKNGFHLLLVDDDAKSRKMMVRYFQRVGYRCDEADNGLRAIEKVEQKVNDRWNDPEAGYSVILMDFVMPFMDGPSATTVLRNKGYMGFIFGLTGNVSHKDKEYFMKRGLDRVFSKPLDTIEFEATIQGLYSKSGHDFTVYKFEKMNCHDDDNSSMVSMVEASKIILQQKSLSAHNQPSIPIKASSGGVSLPTIDLDSRNSLSKQSPPETPPDNDHILGSVNNTQSTSLSQNHQISITLPPPALIEHEEDTFDASVPFVVPNHSTKKTPRSGVLPRRFGRSNIRKLDKNKKMRDTNSPSYVVTSTSVVEGKNPIDLLKESQTQLKSALKSTKPLAAVDESESSGEYRMTPLSGASTPTSYNNYSSFARPFPNRMCEMLIADDSHRNRRIMSQILQLAGYVCDTAYDGQMAVDKVRDRIRDGNARMYDVVLLDIIMPKMDGDQAAKEIRDLGFDGALIAMTGSTHPADHNRFLQAGGNKVILKPLEIKELHSVVLALLPKNSISEPIHAPPKREVTTSVYRPPTLRHEGKEQRSFGDYKSLSSSTIPSIVPSTVPSGQRIELLVVDDSRRNRRLMIKTLVLAGFVCEESDDGQNAVNMVSERIKLINSGKARMYDAILLDIIMPTMDGDVAAKEIRDLGFDGSLIAMTGSPAKEDHDRFLRAGGNQVLLKPLDMEELKAALYTIT